jgi:hypothetical protein
MCADHSRRHPDYFSDHEFNGAAMNDAAQIAILIAGAALVVVVMASAWLHAWRGE